MVLDASEHETIERVLKDLGFFGYLRGNDLERIKASMEKAEIKKDETIIKQGDSGDIFYFLVSGKVGVYLKRQLLDKKVAALEAPTFFGEMSLVGKHERTATVVCDEDCVVYTMLREDFKKIIIGNPHIAMLVERVSVKRKKDTADADFEDRKIMGGEV